MHWSRNSLFKFCAMWVMSSMTSLTSGLWLWQHLDSLIPGNRWLGELGGERGGEGERDRGREEKIKRWRERDRDREGEIVREGETDRER